MHDGAPPRAAALEPGRETPDDGVIAALRAFAAEMPGARSGGIDAVAELRLRLDPRRWSGSCPDLRDLLRLRRLPRCRQHRPPVRHDHAQPPRGPASSTSRHLRPGAPRRWGLPAATRSSSPSSRARWRCSIPESRETVETACFGCHGVGGARQFQIDAHASDGTCPPVRREMPRPCRSPTATRPPPMPPMARSAATASPASSAIAPR